MPYKDREILLRYHREYSRSQIGIIKRKEYRDRSIVIGGIKQRRVSLSFNPRKNICFSCGKKCKCELHHELGYFIIFPWFGIQELCKSCHTKVTKPHIYHRDPLQPRRRNKNGRFIGI